MEKIFVRKRAMSAIIALTVAVTFTACGNNQLNTEETNNPLETVQTEQFTPAGSLRMLQPSGQISPGGAGKDGFYTLTAWSWPDDSFNLAYADYQSHQVVFLCAQPNCTHDSDSCNSYVKPITGGLKPEVIGDKLVLFYLGNRGFSPDSGVNTLPHIEVCELDGSNRHTTLKFDSLSEIELPMVTDETYIYAKLLQYTVNGKESKLIRIDPEQTAYDVICDLDDNCLENICGCTGEKLVLERVTPEFGGSFEYEYYDLSALEREPFYKWTMQSNSQQASPIPYKDAVVIMDTSETNRIRRIDYATGKEKVLDCYELPAPDGWLMHSIYEAEDGHILFLEENYKGGYTGQFYAVDCTNDQIIPWDLTYDYAGEKLPAAIVAEADPEHYFVIQSEEIARQQSLEGSSNIQISQKNFALISKEDYWSGIPNFISFENRAMP